MTPSDRVRETVIWAASRWHGFKAALDPETRFQARLLATAEWKRRRFERKAEIKAALRAYRQARGDERAEALRAGARLIQQRSAQARVDKELELRDRFAERALPGAKWQSLPPAATAGATSEDSNKQGLEADK